MLNAVLDVVREQGWFDTTRPFQKTVYLSQGASLWMVLGRGGVPHTFVKFSDLTDLGAEAARCEAASRAYPDHAPRYIGYATRAPLQVLSARALEFRPLSRRMAAGRRDGAALRAGLEAFFARQRANATGHGGDRPAAPHAWFADFQRHVRGLAPQAEASLRSLEAMLPDLPALPQHGDLVWNNLALDPDRRLIVFDWEDFGEVALPGLDLFTLEYSFSHALAQPLPASPWEWPARWLDIARLCAALGLDPALYERLRPSCAWAFRYLKRRYGPEVQAMVDEAVVAVDRRSGAAVPRR